MHDHVTQPCAEPGPAAPPEQLRTYLRAAADVLARSLPHATCFTIADLAEEFAGTLRDDADWQEDVRTALSGEFFRRCAS